MILASTFFLIRVALWSVVHYKWIMTFVNMYPIEKTNKYMVYGHYTFLSDKIVADLIWLQFLLCSRQNLYHSFIIKQGVTVYQKDVHNLNQSFNKCFLMIKNNPIIDNIIFITRDRLLANICQKGNIDFIGIWFFATKYLYINFKTLLVWIIATSQDIHEINKEYGVILECTYITQ